MKCKSSILCIVPYIQYAYIYISAGKISLRKQLGDIPVQEVYSNKCQGKMLPRATFFTK